MHSLLTGEFKEGESSQDLGDVIQTMTAFRAIQNVRPPKQ